MAVLDIKNTATFNVASSATEAKSFPQILEVVETASGVRLDLFHNLESGSVLEQRTITITLGNPADAYTFSHPALTDAITYLQDATDTANDVASAIAALFNGSGLVEADVASNVITVTFADSADVALIDASASTTPGNAVVAESVAGSGTAAKRKTLSINVAFTVNNQPGTGTDLIDNGKIIVTAQGIEYAGDVMETVVNTGGTPTIYTTQESLSVKQANQGL